MVTGRRVGKWALIGLAGVVAVVVVLRVGVGVFLHTAGGRAIVGQKLGAMVGLPVEVSSVDLGAQSSSLKFRVLDPALAGSPNAEVLAVESATADVSFTEVVTGRASPKELHLSGVTAALRLDAHGKVLTTLPSPKGGGGGGEIPTIVLDNTRVTIHQEGRPEFTLAGITLRVEPAGDKLAVTGAADDPAWGKWTVTGEGSAAAQTGWVTLASDLAPLDPERLKSIPFVSPVVWENARPTGHAAAEGRFTLGANNAFGYDIHLRPKGAALGVPAAEVTLTDLNGVVRIHDGLVEVAGPDAQTARATAMLAGGTVTVAGKYDYGKEPGVLDPLAIRADRLAVKELPAKWGLENLGGKLPGTFRVIDEVLSGTADLKVLYHAGGRVEVSGGGRGVITGTTTAGGDIKVNVRLHANGQKLEFGRDPAPPAKSEPVMQGPPAPLAPPSLLAKANPSPSPSLAKGREQNQNPGSASPSLLGKGDGGLGSEDANPSPGPSPEKGEGKARTLRVEITTERELLALVAFLAVQKAEPKAEPRTDETNLDATITLRDIDVAQFLEQLQIKVPYKIAGRVTVQAKLGVQVGQATTASSYELTGTLTSPQLSVEGLTVRTLTTQVTYKGGKITLKELRGTLPQPGDDQAAPGSFSGTASAAIDPPGDVSAALTLDRLPLGAVASVVPGLGMEVRGQATGKATFKAPYAKVSDPASWDASASVRSDTLTVAGRTATGVTLNAVVAKGVATLKDAAVTVEGIPITAGGTLTLSGKYPFAATVKTAGTSVADLRKLVPEAQLPVPVEGVLETDSKVTGELRPLTFAATGRVTASKLTLNKTPANHLDVKWAVTPDRLRLTDLSAGLFGGALSGALDYPFSVEQTGDFHLAFKDVDAAAAAAFVPDFPVRITGAVSGKVAGTIPPAKAGQSRIGNIDLDLTAPRLTVQNIPAERLVGKAAVKNGALEYALEGKTLGGSFDLKGRYPGAKKAPGVVPAGAQEKKGPAPKGDRGSLRITGIDLAQLAGVLRSESLRPLRGRVDATFDYDNDLSAGAGRVSVRGLGWGTANASQQLDGVLLLRDGTFELRDFAGSLANGYFRARGRVNLNSPRQNFFSVAVDRADAARLLAPVPGLAGLVAGEVSVAVRGRVGREMTGSGEVTVTRGTVGGAEVSELHVPFDYATSPGGYGRIAVREAGTRAGSGRATVNATAEWGAGAGMRVDGRARFIDVPLRAISPALGQNSLLGGGRVTGRFDVSGANVRTADDLTGTLVAALTNASPKELPLLQNTLPYLNPLGATQAFQAGDVRGTLARGVFRVQRLALSNPSAQIFADGSITVRGRLDLNVMAHTGPAGPQATGIRLLVSRIPSIGPIPIGLIRDVTNFVSNRTIRLAVTGTTSNPVVRVDTGALLREEAVRFLLSQYVPVEVGEALGIGAAGAATGGAVGGSK